MTSSVLTAEVRDQLSRTSVATITFQLQRRGIRSTFLEGLRPLAEGQRMVGVAHTLRFVPLREDLNPTLYKTNAQRAAVESLRPGEVLVIEARNELGGATIGDIYALRARALGAVGIVTDGCLRDTIGVRDVGLPVYNRASNAATLGRVHMPLDHQVPIACAGVTVMPGDVIVGDGEGAVVIPAALVVELARDALAQELEDEWSAGRVAAGESTDGVFPISKDRRPEFEAWLAKRSASAEESR
jgi:regulator of RNase E activity RraA